MQQLATTNETKTKTKIQLAAQLKISLHKITYTPRATLSEN